jgi:hypothetical protein
MMASRAQAFQPQPQPFKVARAMLLVEESTRPRIVTNFPEPPVYEVDTGLRAGIKLKFRPDKRNEFPESIAGAITQILIIEKLPAGWDSYEAEPLNDDSVVAAFELIIHAEGICDCPMRVVPLSNGGLGLRWTNEQAELEIDVDPDGTCEAFLDGAALAEPIELPAGSTLADAKELISRHASIR